MPQKVNPQLYSQRYKILKNLGEGGIGIVYQAFDHWTGQVIALKVLSADMINPNLVDSFKSEFLLLSQLKHPGVVKVFDFGFSADKTMVPSIPLPYFTMEFVEGYSLAESFPGLLNHTPLVSEYERLYRLIWQICDILEFLHLRELIHCDLKPDNIKITDHAFRPNILDFGLAEKIGEKRKKDAKGTLPYMAPEMFKEESLDERTDLYSLGIVLYELVTSKLPFCSDDPVKIISAHLQQKPLPPSEINPHLPSSLNDLIIGLLQKPASERPKNAGQVKQMLEQGFIRDFNMEINLSQPLPKNLAAYLLISGPLVGRDMESQKLEDSLKAAASGQAGSIFVGGEQGVGKTILLQHLKAKCQIRGITVVDSNCLQDQTIAYQPLLDILNKLSSYVENNLPAQTVGKLKEIPNKHNEGSSLSVETAQSNVVPDIAEAQAAYHQMIHDLLVDISQIVPLIMIIDNLQWADSSTIGFLKYCQLHQNQGKIFWCGAYRDEGLSQNSSLQALIDHGDSGGCVDCLTLSRFDLSGTRNLIVSKLIKNKFPEEFFAYVHQRTSGNPYFVIEVLKYLLANDILFLKDSSWGVDLERLEKSIIPDSVESVLLRNLQRYDQNIVDFLSVAAIIGTRFSLRLLRELNLFDAKTLSEILTTLINDRLLIQQDEFAAGKTFYEFANQSLQTLLYRRCKKGKRLFWHKAIAEFLEKQKPDEVEESVFEITHHYLQTKEYEKVYHYALLSAERMERRFANRDVLGYLDKALKLTSKFTDKPRAQEKRALVLTKRADFCKKVGDLNQSERDYKTILRLIQASSDLRTQVKTYNNLGEVYRLKHDYRKGISVLKKAMQLHEKIDDPVEHANTLSYLGLLYWTDSQYQNALVSFRKALEIDQKQDNKSYRASTLNNMGLVYWSLHQYSEALKYFTETLSIYRELDDQEWIARSLNNIGQTYFCLGEYTEAIRHYQESLAINEKIENKKEKTFNLENLSEVYRAIGTYASALEYGQKGLDLALEIEFTERVGRISKDLGITYFELGEYQRAYEYFQKSKDVAERIEDKELQILILISLGKFFSVFNNDQRSHQLLEEAIQIINAINDERSLISVYRIKSRLAKENGQFDEALKLLDEANALAIKLNAKEESLSTNLELAELYLSCGETEKSKEYLEQVRNSGIERYILYQPSFYLISGKFELLNGNSVSAQKDLETASELAEKVNNLEIMWRIQHQLGRLFLSAHNFERAYQCLQSAGKILKKLSENIKDKELKQNYMKDNEKKELLSDLRVVANRLMGNLATQFEPVPAKL